MEARFHRVRRNYRRRPAQYSRNGIGAFDELNFVLFLNYGFAELAVAVFAIGLAPPNLLKEANSRHASILMSVVNYGEFYGITLRAYGRDRALSVMTAIRALPLQFTDATPGRALHAADVKTTYRLHYPDSFAAALAIEHKATLLTSDSDFKKLGHGFAVLWLMN